MEEQQPNEQELAPKVLKILDDIKSMVEKGGVKDGMEALRGLSDKLDSKYALIEPHDPLTWRIRQWLEQQDGNFDVRESYKELEIVSPKDKSNVRNLFHRLVKDGVIARDGKRSGAYRKVDKELDIIDWKNAPTTTVPLWLPFNLNEWVDIFPRDIIVFAGYPSVGKSAISFNIIKNNMALFHVHYLSSELGATGIKKRLSYFDDMPESGWDFNAVSRPDNFADIIQPGDITIIDYLTLHDQFYLVAKHLDDIWKKIGDGIAIVCLQKQLGKDTALGGSFSLHRPNLYVSLDPGQAKIIKAKNWKTPLNPVGRVLDFKIINGCKFLHDGKWRERDPEELKQEQPRYRKVWS